VAAGFQCYIDQISGSMMDNMLGKSVLVLSDISPGNVRVTEDGKKLAILDRAFYQHITVKDRLFLMAVLKTPNAEKLATTVASYLREEGQAPDDLDTATSRLTEVLKARLENGPDESLISFITVDAYTAGFTFPLRLQLIARGMAAWRQMALQAGFSSLQEARSFQG
jgi:predicted unusual protein kinase regulating ubiquinone biosynthesis (AarF/ABC1/UbiB family)